MITSALAVSGWTATAIAALLAVMARRSRAGLMEVVARVGHELRGPITATRLGLQLGARTDELSVARLRAMDLELGRAALALEDLSQASRPRSGPYMPRELEEIDVAELLADSVEAWRPSGGAPSAELELSSTGERATVRGDRLRLAQATGNLIANAFEHGGGRIEVRVRSEAGRVRVEVTDDGPGLPAPVAALTRRAHGGRGARGRGLAIAAAIAEHHGGRIAGAPSERGARLVLELPAASPHAATAPLPGQG